MPRFNVTYGIITPESAEHGDYEETGFVVEDVRLREAIEAMGRFATEDSGRWITNDEYGHGTRRYYEQGIEETRSLHPPESITDSSYRRLKRLLGLSR